MPTKKIISLDELLTSVAGQFRAFGRVHDVLPVTALEYQLLQEMDWATADIGPVRAMVKRIVPSLSSEEHDRLTLAAIGEILKIGSGMVDLIEAEVPNSSAPATTAQTPAPTSESRSG